MIIELTLILGKMLLKGIMALFGILPDMPHAAVNAIDKLFEFMISGVGFATVFIDFRFVKILLPITIAIINFDKIVKLVMWIIRKIPFTGIE